MSEPRNSSSAASSADVIRLLGDLDEAAVIEVLALQPGLDDLEETAVWAGGQGDVLGKEGKPLSPKAGAILDILASYAEDDPERL